MQGLCYTMIQQHFFCLYVCLDIIKVSAKWYNLLIYLKINKVYVELIGLKRLLAESH